MKLPDDQANGQSSKQAPDQHELIAGAREAMARRDESLDGETLSRLRRARSAALDESAGRHSLANLWLPAGLASAAAVVAVALLVGQGEAPHREEVDLLADAWILDEEAELEMIEDVEFYQWLAEEALDGHST